MSALKTACLYSLKPHQLGFCGPLDNKISSQLIIDYIQGQKNKEMAIRKILEEFIGSYGYYQQIAKKNSIKDPLAQKVVRAYWLGNDLLKKAGSYKAHHSWHVYKIGSVTNRIKFDDKLRDLCRVSWGQVQSISKQLVVQGQPIIKKGKKYILSQPVIKKIDWDKKIIPQVKKGDIVSIHWNQAVEVLNKKEAASLEKYTQMTLDNI